eukprot:2107242-Karenia_brevis.AAC.1
MGTGQCPVSAGKSCGGGKGAPGTMTPPTPHDIWAPTHWGAHSVGPLWWRLLAKGGLRCAPCPSMG